MYINANNYLEYVPLGPISISIPMLLGLLVYALSVLTDTRYELSPTLYTPYMAVPSIFDMFQQFLCIHSCMHLFVVYGHGGGVMAFLSKSKQLTPYYRVYTPHIMVYCRKDYEYMPKYREIVETNNRYPLCTIT